MVNRIRWDNYFLNIFNYEWYIFLWQVTSSTTDRTRRRRTIRRRCRSRWRCSTRRPTGSQTRRTSTGWWLGSPTFPSSRTIHSTRTSASSGPHRPTWTSTRKSSTCSISFNLNLLFRIQCFCNMISQSCQSDNVIIDFLNINHDAGTSKFRFYISAITIEFEQIIV